MFKSDLSLYSLYDVCMHEILDTVLLNYITKHCINNPYKGVTSVVPSFVGHGWLSAVLYSNEVKVMRYCT